jgi:hypothetical protein
MMKLARKFYDGFIHLYFPHEGNNFKAKILHPSGFFFLKVLLIVVQVGITFFHFPRAKILGFAANISPQEVVQLTNQKRVEAGLNPLEENPTLSQAALAKGTDMINRDYWAHVSPDGTQPWSFFINYGYKYRYAGENLARDFSSPSSAVDAWMASSSHKENMLSAKYKEIGIGVVEGELDGVDTTIIVQFFGTKYSDTIPLQPVAKVPAATVIPTQTPAPTAAPETSSPTLSPLASPTAFSETEIASIKKGQEPEVLVSPFNTTKGISLAVVGLLLTVLVVDAFVTSKRRIRRIGGRTFAHIAFLGMLLAIILILKAGQIV